MKPRLFSNLRVYNHIGGLYDAALGFWSRKVRRAAAGALDLREGDRLLIVGVGSGMELEHLPTRTRGVGVDLSDGMLRRARRRRRKLRMEGLNLRVMDAQRLDFPDGSFEAVYLPLILTVAESGARVLGEAARVAAPEGRIVVADRFWSEEKARPAAVRAAGWLLGHFAMRFDLRFSEIRTGAPSLELRRHEKVGPGFFFDLVTLRKPGSGKPG